MVIMKPTITLCMIVKNETKVIERCLRSMAPFVDRYDITDTGSTDGTQDLIRKTMEELGVPGEVHQSDWKGFGDHAGKIGSRTESLQNCEGKADYAWIIDADDSIEGTPILPTDTEADSYSLRITRGDFTWWRNQIFKIESKWRYVGILHEFAECTTKTPPAIKRLEGDYKMVARTEGSERNSVDSVEKYSRDAQVLEDALKDEPQNMRYQFYLAQSYFDCQQFEKARDNYIKRVEMGGWQEEAFYSMYRAAMCDAILNKPLETIIHSFVQSYNLRPSRAEPLYQIARIYRLNNLPAVGYLYAKQALEIPYPENDILFIQDEVYKYGVLDEVGACAYYAGKPHVGYAACKKLLDENLVPAEHRERVQTNLDSYVNVISQINHQNVTVDIDNKLKLLKKKQEEKKNKKLMKQEKISKGKKSTKTPSINSKYKSRKK